MSKLTKAQTKALPDNPIIQDVLEFLGTKFRAAFELLKGIFRGGVWVHIRLDEKGKIIFRITLGKDGPEIHREALDEKGATALLETLSSGDLVALKRNRSIRKRGRLAYTARKALAQFTDEAKAETLAKIEALSKANAKAKAEAEKKAAEAEALAKADEGEFF